MSILLIHTTSDPRRRYGLLHRAAGRTAPLGLACLAATFAGEVSWIDLQSRLPERGDLDPFRASLLTAVIVQAASDWEMDFSLQFSQRLAAFLPGVPRILAGVVPSALAEAWDGGHHGTGFTLLQRILAGNLPIGETNFLDLDLRQELAISPEPLSRTVDYRAAAEKTGGAATLSIYQPWMGLLDRADVDDRPPPLEFLGRLSTWLKASGFPCQVLESCGGDGRRYVSVLEPYLALPVEVALTIPDPRQFPPAAPRLARNLFGVWLAPAGRRPPRGTPPGVTSPESLDLAEFIRLAERFVAAGVPVGIRLDAVLAADPALEPLLAIVQDISCSRPGSWPPGLLRNVLRQFYLRQGHLWRKLLGVRTAFDLIRFLRGAYGILEAILVS